ncbi:MAG: hypothetical protein M0041_03735 [Nitrospiraceae bacterium]|nr:hypothetical protein [Nitrospiraceae bacterium]
MRAFQRQVSSGEIGRTVIDWRSRGREEGESLMTPMETKSFSKSQREAKIPNTSHSQLNYDGALY